MQAEMYGRERCGERGHLSGFVATRETLAREAAAFGRPVLLIHGDEHFWMQDRPVAGAQNVTRIMVPGAADTRGVRVDVNPDAAEPWSFALVGADDRAARPGC
jgi:hypothetical protein